MTVDGLETEASNGFGERVERAAHVDGLDRDEDADRRRKAQRDRSTSTTRRSVSAAASSPNSSRAPPTSSTYRAHVVPMGPRGTSSTRALATGRGFAARLVRGAYASPLSKLIFHAWSERPSMP